MFKSGFNISYNDDAKNKTVFNNFSIISEI